MSKRRKAVEKLRCNPKNVRFDDVDTLLISLGFDKRQKGSHTLYSLGDYRIGIPARRPFVLPCYVRNLLQLLDDLDETLMDDDDE